MNKVAKFFYFIYMKAVGEDIDTIRYVIKQNKEGKPVLDPIKKKLFIQSLKEAPRTVLKESWLWILVVLFAFGMGSILGMRYAEVKCNNFIIETFPDYFEVSPFGDNNSLYVPPNFSIPPSYNNEQESNKEYNP